jgi:hypothetical protein
MPIQMPARSPLPAAAWTPVTSSCVMLPCTPRASAFPLGLGVLTGKGVTAWRRVLAHAGCSTPGHRAGAARHRPHAAGTAAGPGGHHRARPRPGRRCCRAGRHLTRLSHHAPLTAGASPLSQSAAGARGNRLRESAGWVAVLARDAGHRLTFGSSSPPGPRVPARSADQTQRCRPSSTIRSPAVKGAVPRAG